MLVTIPQAVAILTMWRSREFDTNDIATEVGIAEPVVCKVLDEVRKAERRPNLYLVGEPA